MSIIVEVGAHRGAETFNFLSDAKAQVYAFEPEAQHFRELLQRIQPYGDQIILLPFAVDIGDNQEPLFHYEDGKSTLQCDFGTITTNYTMAWTIRLDTFMYLYSVEQIDYLRIDAPFREEMILESLGDKISKVARGRIRQYGEKSVIPAWLYDHGFNLELDTTSQNTTEPDIRFWR
jgi:FkbM family methyltransferase